MKKRILRWLFGYDLEEYKDILHHWSKSIDGWGKAINIAKDSCDRNERLIELTDSIVNRYKRILRNAITTYEFELERQVGETAADLHTVVLNEFGMTDEEYKEIMGVK